MGAGKHKKCLALNTLLGIALPDPGTPVSFSYSKHRRGKRKPLSMSTLNRKTGVARRVLRLAATVWREADSNLTWLAAAPLIQLESDPTARKAYPLDWDEQRLLFSELAPHLQRMALFDVNTELRDQKLCNLRWSWEQRVPELDTPEIKRSVFVRRRRV